MKIRLDRQMVVQPVCARLALAGALALCAMIACPAGRSQNQTLDPKQIRKATEAAVVNGLDFLAKSQLKDGSFAPGGHAAVAALSIMAFLAHGDLPGQGKYGETINHGIDFVLGCQNPNGEIASGMYTHGIATLMLAECSGMVDPERQKRIDEALSKALRLILAAQEVAKPAPMQGGWRYDPQSTDSDISLSGWATMALWAARNSGATVPKEAMDKAVGFIMNCRCADGGFAYQPGGGSGYARTAIALLCLEAAGGRHADEVTTAAGKYLLDKIKSGWSGEYFYYGLYYSAQGMYRLGGDMWKEFAPIMYDKALKLQNADGSWPPAPPGFNSENAGPCFSTAMALLAISVEFAQLPTYQK